MFRVEAYGKLLCDIRIPLPGRHNILNTLAGIAVGYELGVDFDPTVSDHPIPQALEKFEGVHRRFEVMDEINDVMLVVDFAHHPTEVAATLAAAKEGWGRPIVALFQPHLFSRTQALATEFGRALMAAETAIALPIFPAREEPIPGVTSQLIVDAARDAGHKQVYNFENKKEAVQQLKEIVHPGDMVMVLGAGDVYQLVQQVIEILKY
ncbi:MAG: cyanophycin synthetase [Candidatus Electryoneaceae bacterium]|nr:cyanophycin synthetase [Candidatus Electryoneaceae bacterium]